MFILEISDSNRREAIIVHIINSLFEKSFTNVTEALIVEGFSYLDHSLTTKTNKISVSDIKKFKKSYHLRSDGKKLAIINNANNLTVESQNALLKDLEEEPEETITIIALSDKRKLLPTIRSRGIFINESDLSLIHKSIKQAKIPDLLYNADSKGKELQYIDKFLNLPFFEQLIYINKLITDKKNFQNPQVSQEKKDLVESFLLDLLSYYETLLNEKGVNIVDKIKLVEGGLQKIEKGVNERAVLEYILLKINYA